MINEASAHYQHGRLYRRDGQLDLRMYMREEWAAEAGTMAVSRKSAITINLVSEANVLSVWLAAL
jgi:hypothetical protein